MAILPRPTRSAPTCSSTRRERRAVRSSPSRRAARPGSAAATRVQLDARAGHGRDQARVPQPDQVPRRRDLRERGERVCVRAVPARSTSRIACRVRNFMGREGVGTAAVRKAGNPKPCLMIDGGTQTITIADKLRLQVHADFPVLCEGISLPEPRSSSSSGPSSPAACPSPRASTSGATRACCARARTPAEGERRARGCSSRPRRTCSRRSSPAKGATGVDNSAFVTVHIAKSPLVALVSGGATESSASTRSCASRRAREEFKTPTRATRRGGTRGRA